MNSSGIVILSSPSGGGKTSLAKALSEKRANTGIAISHTTRPRRPNETHGVDYFFVDQTQFQQMIDENAFIEYANVFGNFYGTSFKSIDNLTSTGKYAILDIDWQGARIVKKKYPAAVSVFVMPPSIADLEKRLQQRNQDSPATIKLRMQEAAAQVSHKDEFDIIVINNYFQQALEELQDIVDNLVPITKTSR